jgi:hypothetical protein
MFMEQNNNQSSPAFSKFRELLDLWDKNLIEEADTSSIRAFLDGNKFIMYFVFTSDKEAKEIFGTDEDNRIIFSRLKNPSKHEIVDPSEFFTAINIRKALNSEEGLNDETMISFSRGFSKKDLKKIKIVDQDFVLKKMKNIIKKDPKVHKNNEKEVLSDDEA